MIQTLYKHYVRHAGVLLCAAVCGYWLFQSFYYLPHDFSNSYFGGYFFLRGEFDTGIFDPYTFNKRIYDEGFREIYVSYNPNPPFSALFFAPLALLPLHAAKLAFNIVSCAWFFISIYRLCKFKQVEPGWIFLLLPVLFFTPFRNQILFGQTYFLLFALLVEGYLAWEQKSEWQSSLLWGLAIFLKVFPVIIFLFLLTRREWRATAKLAAVCLGLLAVSISLQGIEVWKFYLTDVLPPNGRGEIGGAYVVNYQSVLMFFKYAFYGDPQLNPYPLVNSPVAYEVALLLLKSLLLGFCVHLIKRSGNLLSFGFLLLTAILLSPYGSTYTYILLAILLVACYTDFRRYFIPMAVVIFLIANLPLSLFESLPPLWQFPRLALLLVLFGSVVVLARIKLDWKIVALFVTLFSIPAFNQLRMPKDASTFLETRERFGLVFDYHVRDGWLVCKYWDTNGENTRRTDIQSNRLSQEDIALKGNQVFFRNTQLTHTLDQKLKPAMLDDGRIIYLSDKFKGMGFYSLRVIDLGLLNNANH